jgi:hypothetical protein
MFALLAAFCITSFSIDYDKAALLLVHQGLVPEQLSVSLPDNGGFSSLSA